MAKLNAKNVIIERRTLTGYKLRVYMDAIRDAEGMTDAEWVARAGSTEMSGPYIPRLTWIAYLKDCALKESERFFGVEREVA